MLKAVGFCSIFVLWTIVSHAEGQTCSYLGMCARTRECNLPWCQRPTMVPCRKTQACTIEWSSWTRCNRLCGGGTRRRGGICRGEECSRIVSGSEDCNTDPCQRQRVDGNWAEWSPWIAGSCSESCCGGTYSQSRSRTCTDPAPKGRGKPCQGNEEETMYGMKCSMEGCPMSCENKTIGTVFPDNCGMCSRRFFACDGDVMPTELTCPEEYYYNDGEKKCEPDSNCFGLA